MLCSSNSFMISVTSLPLLTTLQIWLYTFSWCMTDVSKNWCQKLREQLLYLSSHILLESALSWARCVTIWCFMSSMQTTTQCVLYGCYAVIYCFVNWCFVSAVSKLFTAICCISQSKSKIRAFYITLLLLPYKYGYLNMTIYQCFC